METTDPTVRPGLTPTIRCINRIAYGHVLPAALWLLLAWPMIARLPGGPLDLDTVRTVANLSFTLLVAVLFIVRRLVVGKRSDLPGALVAVAGTFCPMLIARLPAVPEMALTGTLVTLAGLLFSLFSLAALGRCFGIFPEARGLVRHGPYRLVRHPLYLGEIVAMLGMALSALSSLALVLFIVSAGLQMWRAKNEEKALESTFPEYGEYIQHTRRMIPLVW